MQCCRLKSYSPIFSTMAEYWVMWKEGGGGVSCTGNVPSPLEESKGKNERSTTEVVCFS